MLVKETIMGAELQSQNRFDLCDGKTVGLGAWLTKALWKSNNSLCLSQVISTKIVRVAAIYTSKFKWVWRAQFLSHTFQILEIN